MPSPTMATFEPDSCSSRTTRSLSAGITPARTSSMPTACAMAPAVTGLSPVSMTTRAPRPRSAVTASALVGFIWSATAMVPTSEPFRAKKSGAPPSGIEPVAQAAVDVDAELRLTSSALPAATRLAPSRAVTPRPGSASSPRRAARRFPAPSARRITASASGCSLLLSRAAASLSRAFSDAAEPSSRGAGIMSINPPGCRA